MAAGEHAGGETLADHLNARAAKIDRVDHFEALGVHWSVPRADIERAYRSLQEMLGPGKPGRAGSARGSGQDPGPRR